MMQEFPETDPVGPDSIQEITPQGSIHINADCDQNILENRRMSAQFAKPDETVIGEFSVHADALTLRPMQVAMVDKKNQYMGNARTTHKVTVFTSFAGMRVKKTLTQRKFERGFTAIGFVLKLGDASKISPPTSGVSVRKGGSGTTINSSGVTFMPGDVFGVRLPAIDENERSRQYASESARRLPHSRPRGTFGATIKKITYKDIVGEFHEIAEHLLQNNSAINLPLIRKHPSSSQVIGDEYDQEATCLKAYNSAAFLSGVQAVLESGLVVPTISSVVGRAELARKWEEARAPIVADPNNTKAIYEHYWAGGPSNDAEFDKATADIVTAINGAGGAANIPAAIRGALVTLSQDWSGRFVRIDPTNPDLSIRRSAAYKEVISNLAVKFGIAYDPAAGSSIQSSDMNDENYGMTLSANVRLLIGSVGGSFQTTERESLANHVKKDLAFTQQVKRDSFNTPVTFSDTVADQILKTYYEAAGRWVKLCGRSFDNAMRMAMGNVLNYSRPNNALHYSLT